LSRRHPASAISDKIAELATTGHLRFLDRLHGEVPPTLAELLEVPGVGPKTVRLLWERLGIETLDDLRTGLRAGTIRGVPGLSEKGLAALAAGVEAVDRRSTRMTLGTAERIIEGVAALLRDVPGVRRVEPAASYRAGATRSVTWISSSRRTMQRRSSNASRRWRRSSRSSTRAHTRLPSGWSGAPRWT
jgi:DNA polymerase/3'-5' exonuclease PolX